MSRTGLNANIKVSNLYATLTALGKMPDNAKAELKDAAFELSQDIAKTMRINARAQSRQAPLMAATISTGSDTGSDSDLPVVQAGGSQKVGRNRKPAYKLLFGSEFGAVALRQFKPRNPTGYWFFRTATEMAGEIDDRWHAAADKVIAEFADAPDGA